MLLKRKIKGFSNYIANCISTDKLEAIAKETGFKQRTSIITPQAFLDTLFFSNSQSCPTLTDYSIDMEHQGMKGVSKQAIDKRFNLNTKQMLTHILGKIITNQVRRSLPTKHKYFSEIRIMDSSQFIVSKNLAEAFPGYGGKGREAIAQVQLEYDLLGGKVTELHLGSATDSDCEAGMINIDKMPPKALLVRDLAYFAPKFFKEISERDIFFISRAKTQWTFYEQTSEGEVRLSAQTIIERLKKQKEKYLDIDILVGEKVKAPVRLIANLLTESQTKERIKKKKSNRGTLSKDAEETACLNIFVTNIDREISDSCNIYQLYSLRWQIELIFKTWKSILRIHKLHPMNAIRLECIILIKFIWVMLNWSILKLMEEAHQQELSLPKLTRTLISRSKVLTMEILQSSDLLYKWLEELSKLSKRHHRKEYKKGRSKITEILYTNNL